MKRIFWILSISLLVFSCEDSEEKSGDLFQLKEKGGIYSLIELDGEDISSEDYVLQHDSENKRISGKTGCNNFISAYEIIEDRIEFRPTLGTKMYCEGEMEHEETFEEILPLIRKVQISGEELVFLSEENEELIKLQKTKTSE